jgi:DNA-binding response OmpR family regulator
MSPKPEPHLGTVLVVDDAVDTLRMLCDALADEGYTVLVARDGQQALERLSLILPDAILLDAVMPGLSGFDTCRQIKAHEVWCKIPVIFMTGLSETADVVAGFDAGGVDYVVKPVRIEEVLARLATHLRNAWGTRPRLDLAALTPRETEVLSWLAKGKTNRDIAEILGLSHRTVNKHLEHIFEKLGVETRAAAAALASRAVLA